MFAKKGAQSLVWKGVKWELSLPVRERGLKRTASISVMSVLLSLPVRERG